MIWDSQQGFTNDKLSLTNMVVFYGGRQNNVIYLTCRAHNIVSQSILISKLEMDMEAKGGLISG